MSEIDKRNLSRKLRNSYYPMTKIEKLRDILKFTIDLVNEVLFTKYLNLLNVILNF